jgi:hypothetical protein
MRREDLLDTAEAAAFMLFPAGPKGINGFRVWVHRWSVPRKYRGRRVFFERQVLQAFLDGKKWTRKAA